MSPWEVVLQSSQVEMRTLANVESPSVFPYGSQGRSTVDHVHQACPDKPEWWAISGDRQNVDPAASLERMIGNLQPGCGNAVV